MFAVVYRRDVSIGVCTRVTCTRCVVKPYRRLPLCGHCVHDLGPLFYASVVRTTVAKDHRSVVLSSPPRATISRHDEVYTIIVIGRHCCHSIIVLYVPRLGCRVFSTETTQRAKRPENSYRCLHRTCVPESLLNSTAVTAVTDNAVTDFFTTESLGRCPSERRQCARGLEFTRFFHTDFAVIGQAHTIGRQKLVAFRIFQGITSGVSVQSVVRDGYSGYPRTGQWCTKIDSS